MMTSGRSPRRRRAAFVSSTRSQKTREQSIAAVPAAKDSAGFDEALNSLMQFLKFWEPAPAMALGSPSKSLDEERTGMERLLGPHGAIAWFRWAEVNKAKSDALKSGLTGKLTKPEPKPSGLLAWLQDIPWLPFGKKTTVRVTKAPIADGTRIRDLVAYTADSLCPWDYDRKEPGVTFVNVWTDAEGIEGLPNSQRVKLASTIKLIEQEWKLTARARVLGLGREGVVFGKAGIYIAGEKDPFIGVEADKVIRLPLLSNTGIFGNVNFRSSRKPDVDPVLGSCGLQQTIPFGRGRDLTFRVGIDSAHGKSRVFFSPLPYSSYF